MLCLTLFIMAVGNLYNTAVEYHSPLAAEPPPPTHKRALFLLRPSYPNTSPRITSVSYRSRLTTRSKAIHMENPGCIVVVVVVVMDSDSCLLLCVMLPLSTHSHPYNGACGHTADVNTHTNTVFLK